MVRFVCLLLLAGILTACNPLPMNTPVADNGVLDILWVGDDQLLTGPLDMQTLLLLELGGEKNPIQMDRAINPRYTISTSVSDTDFLQSHEFLNQDIIIIQAFGIQRDNSMIEFEENADSWDQALQVQGKEVVLFYPWFTSVDSESTKESYDEMVHKIAWQQELTLVPVGPAWEAALEARPDLPLYARDGIHPSALGVYLTACVFYASLSGESPIDNPVYTSIGFDNQDEIIKLDSDTVEFLQAIAWETINEYLKKDEFRVIIKE